MRSQFTLPDWAAILAPEQCWEGQAQGTAGARAEVGLGRDPSAGEHGPFPGFLHSSAPACALGLTFVPVTQDVNGLCHCHWCPIVGSWRVIRRGSPFLSSPSALSAPGLSSH